MLTNVLGGPALRFKVDVRDILDNRLDNGLGIYGMSHVSMNIIKQIHDEACAIYQSLKL